MCVDFRPHNLGSSQADLLKLSGHLCIGRSVECATSPEIGVPLVDMQMRKDLVADIVREREHFLASEDNIKTD